MTRIIHGEGIHHTHAHTITTRRFPRQTFKSKSLVAVIITVIVTGDSATHAVFYEASRPLCWGPYIHWIGQWAHGVTEALENCNRLFFPLPKQFTPVMVARHVARESLESTAHFCMRIPHNLPYHPEVRSHQTTMSAVCSCIFFSLGYASVNMTALTLFRLGILQTSYSISMTVFLGVK